MRERPIPVLLLQGVQELLDGPVYVFRAFGHGEVARSVELEVSRPWNGLIVYPMYHPAAALRNGSLRAALERDFQKLLPLLEKGMPDARPQEAEQSEQLSFL